MICGTRYPILDYTGVTISKCGSTQLAHPCYVTAHRMFLVFNLGIYAD